MMWQLTEARNKFSELVSRALSEGPQRVKRRGEVVVVLAERDYKKLKESPPSFKRFLLEQTPNLEGLDLTRDRSSMRDAEL